MTANGFEVKRGENFTVAELGKLSHLDRFSFKLPSRKLEVEGKLFINQLVNLTSCEISFYHKHKQNEEIYLFIQGRGEFQIDGKVFPVNEGTAIRVDPDGERTLRNISEEDLIYIVIQARANSYEGHTIVDGVAVDKRVSWVNKESL